MSPHPADAQASSRTRLLQAAKQLFARNGYEQTATSAIAREAGASESQLMRYFGGKAGLLDAVFDDAWTAINARVKRVVDTPGSSRGTILNVLQTLAAALAHDPDLGTLFMFERQRLRGDVSRVRVSKGFLVFSEAARGLVRRGQAAREIDPSLDAGAITSSIIGATEAMMRHRLMARAGGSRAFAERGIQRTLDAMLAGFAAGSGRLRRTARTPTRAAKRPK